MTRKSILFMISFFFLLAGGIGVRVWNLGGQSLWTDEIAAALIAARSIPEILITIAVQDVNPPLYYLLLHFWQGAANSEFFLRLLSVIFAAGSLLGIWLLGRRLFDEWTALMAAGLFSLAPLSVYLSQEVRYYTLLQVLTLFAFYGYLKVRDGKSGAWLALPVALGLYTHYYFLLVLLCLAVWFWLDFRDREIKDMRFAKPMLTAVLVWAPWIAAMALQTGRGSYRFRPKTSLADMLLDLTTFLTIGHADNLNPLKEGPIHAGLLLFALPFLLLIALFALLGRKKRVTWQVLIWLFLPILAVAVLSRFVNVYGHRYFILVLPALILALAAGIRSLARPWLSIPAFLLILCLQGASLASYFQHSRYWREDWRGLAAMVSANEQEQDGLLFFNEAQAGPFDFYYRGAMNREYALTGDPFVFHQEDKKEIEKRLDTYFKKYRRMFFLPHYAHMYEPAGHTTAYIDQNGIDVSLVDGMEEFRLPFKFIYTSRKNAFRELWKTYDPFIDFSKGNFHPSQLEGELTHLKDSWVWMGKWARFYLRLPGNETRVRLKLMVDLKYHKQESLSLFLLADGKPIKTFFIQESGEAEFSSDLPAIQGELVEIGLFTKQTFNPKEFFGGEDQSPKSLMIGYVGLE